jgi:hypothetical protein
MEIVADDTLFMITPSDPNSNWITIDENGKLLTEGRTPNDAIEAALKKTKDFTVIYVPKEGNTYIF